MPARYLPVTGAASHAAVAGGQYGRVRGPFVVLVVATVALLSACGSGSSNQAAPLTTTTATTVSKADQAQATMTQACIRFAETFLSTDPNSGVAPMTLQQGIANIRQAAALAHTAAGLDGKWASAQLRLTALGDAMSQKNAANMRTALPQVATICTPLMSEVSDSTTVPAG